MIRITVKDRHNRILWHEYFHTSIEATKRVEVFLQACEGHRLNVDTEVNEPDKVACRNCETVQYADNDTCIDCRFKLLL